MCGIVGAFAFDKFATKAEERTRQEAIIFITTQLLQATVERGKDATGVSLIWDNGNYVGLKMGIPAPDFISRFGESETDFEGLVKLWREYPRKMQIFLGHCRKSSVGNSYDNKNNHPIQVGDLLMVHNGTLLNHDVIFDKLNCHREGEVDSEAICRLLYHYTKDGTEPFTSEIIMETVKRLEGTYSVLAANGNNPFQVAQFRDGKPAEAVLVRPLKTVFIASEEKFLKNVLFEFNKMGKLFAPTVKFPHITKTDCDFKMLQDDSMSLWDLTVPIDDKTSITDLYDWQKTALRSQRIWQSKSTYSNTSYNNNNSGTEVDASSKVNTDDKDKDDDNDDTCGLLWSATLNKYKTQKGIDKSKYLGSVEIDTETGAVKEVNDSEETDITEVTAEKIENLIDSTAPVDELKIDKTKEAIGFVKDGKKSDDSSSEKGKKEISGVDSSKQDISGNKANNGNRSDDDRGKSARPSSGQNLSAVQQASLTTEVDMTQHPDALKRAEEYVNKGLMKYENPDEVVNALDIGCVSALDNLPSHALANRIKKFIFKEAFITGYVTRKLESGGNNSDEVAKLKEALNAAERRIALLKMTTRIMGKTLAGIKGTKLFDLIDKVIGDILNKTSNSRLNFDAVFTKGDLRSIPMLKDIKERIETKVKEVADGNDK